MPDTIDRSAKLDRLRNLPDDAVVLANDLETLGYGHRVTLAKWRAAKKGPPFVRLSSHRIAYRLGDVRAWMAARTVKAAA